MKKIYFAVWVSLCFIGCDSKRQMPEENIDHVLLAINNLEKGMAEFKERTGIEPVFGGVHPNSFTQNALVALDGEAYIEIIAPRTDAKDIPALFDTLTTLTPIGYAVRSRNSELTKQKIKAKDFDPSESKPGSRSKPDGELLSWSTFTVNGQADYQFFIEWGASTVHPSATSPAGCTLIELISTTANEQQKKLVELLLLKMKVQQGTKEKIELIIDTPKGKIEFPAAAF